MVAVTAQGSENIPTEKIKLTEEQALNIQKNVVRNWPNFKDVFFLRYGRYIAAVSVFVTSTLCINVYHPVLKFGRGTFTAVLPSIILPPAFVLYKNEEILTNDILVMKKNCALCSHFKFLAFQTYAGLVFPGFLGMLSANSGRNIPVDMKDSSDYWKKTVRITKSSGGVFKGALAFQIFIALLIPYGQQIEIVKIIEKINNTVVEEDPQAL